MAQNPSGPVAYHRIAYFFAGCNAHARFSCTCFLNIYDNLRMHYMLSLSVSPEEIIVAAYWRVADKKSPLLYYNLILF